MRIDLNCDLGESFGAWTMGADEAVMPSISSANIACGFHAGDPSVIRRTMRLARHHGVAVGAHPGFPDLAGFGRRDMHIAPSEVEDLVLYQVCALAGIAAAEGLSLAHVKPHGALYTMATRDESLADAVARGVAAADTRLVLFGLPGSKLLDAGKANDLRVAAEGFADRAYESNGSLRSRRLAGAVITDRDTVVARALQMVVERTVSTVDGGTLPLVVDTICVHGDTPGAADLAHAVRAALIARGVHIAPPDRREV
jgi:5-oxoprolinase (ATP-hydrolysing) subunit A